MGTAVKIKKAGFEDVTSAVIISRQQGPGLIVVPFDGLYPQCIYNVEYERPAGHTRQIASGQFSGTELELL
jgi:hypothetical protein